MKLNLTKEGQKIFDAYILGIPYNGKIISDEVMDQFFNLTNNKKDWK